MILWSQPIATAAPLHIVPTSEHRRTAAIRSYRRYIFPLPHQPSPRPPASPPAPGNLLAELEEYRYRRPKSALASAACGQRWRGAAEAWSRWRGEATAENKITNEDGGEATGAFAVQSSGSSKLVERRVVSSQGGAASPLPSGAPSPRAAPPSCRATCAGCSHTNEWGSHTNEWGLDSLSQMTGSPLKFEKYSLGNGLRR